MKYLCFEGPDGGGKSTLFDWLLKEKEIKRDDLEVVGYTLPLKRGVPYEWEGQSLSHFAEFIRRAAAVKAAADAGKFANNKDLLIVSDRSFLSVLVYGRSDKAVIASFEGLAKEALKTLFEEVVMVVLHTSHNRKGEFESNEALEACTKAYKKFDSWSASTKVVHINTDQGLPAVQQQIKSLIDDMWADNRAARDNKEVKDVKESS